MSRKQKTSPLLAHAFDKPDVLNGSSVNTLLKETTAVHAGYSFTACQRKGFWQSKSLVRLLLKRESQPNHSSLCRILLHNMLEKKFLAE